MWGEERSNENPLSPAPPLCPTKSYILVLDGLLATLLFLRTVQYGAKLVSWLMEQQDVDKSILQRVRQLESSISTARKRVYSGLHECLSLRSAFSFVCDGGTLLLIIISSCIHY